MCGRFTLFDGLEILKKHFPIDQAASEITPNYNVAPTQEIPILFQAEGKYILDKYHWGLVPFWADDIKIGSKMINARVETVETKPAFRNAFRKRRCLVPANGFYEWQGKKGQKQPMYLTRTDRKLFAFAGLWETWDKSANPDDLYKSCTIITTMSSESIRHIHTRMPIILKPDAYSSWLDPGYQDIKNLKDILINGIITDLASHPVSKRVNNVENNDPDNIQPVGQ